MGEQAPVALAVIDRNQFFHPGRPVANPVAACGG